MDSNLSLRLSFPPLPRVNRSKHHRITLWDQCSAIQKTVSDVVSCCGFQCRWLHCKHLLHLASFSENRDMLISGERWSCFYIGLVFCTRYFFQAPPGFTTNKIHNVMFSVGIYYSLCRICFLKLRFFWKDKLQKVCACLLSLCWCWLYFSRRQRDPGRICFCWLVEDIRAALFTVTELPLLCDIMTANSRPILKCVNSCVYGCRLT